MNVNVNVNVVWRQNGGDVMEDDSDLAYNLQLQEALAASLLDSGVPSPSDAVFDASLPQNYHLYEYERQLLDQYKSEAEARRLRLDLRHQISDRAFACEILNVPQGKWSKTGDHLNRPYGEGSSSSSSNGQVSGFRVYVKGLVEQTAGGIGVAVCDGNDILVFELSKVFSGTEGQANEELVELEAAIEGLDVAVMLGLNRVSIVTDNPLVHQYIAGKNPPMTPNVVALSVQKNILLRNLTETSASLVAHKDMKLAVQLARNAMAFNIHNSGGHGKAKSVTVSCAICLEDTYVDQMYQIPGCQHSYCFSCMSKHVQFKLLQGILPKCPHENCNSKLKLDGCKNFLTPQLFDIMSQRVMEASIPAADKIYCPYPRCSTLMSKSEAQGSVASNLVAVSGRRRCPRCNGKFCINCKVPWHSKMSCSDFKKLNAYPCKEDKKLKSLASQNLWRQCPKCSHMVSLAKGCYHIYCRCGHEFCYKCGAEWKKKKATCRCPIWDERNIIYDEHNRRRAR